MLKIVFYISHIYDVTLYKRILEELNFNVENSIVKILISPKVSKQLGINIDSIFEIGEFYIMPYSLDYSEGLINNYIYCKKIKNWLEKLGLYDYKLISNDKSQFLSIFLLSHFKKILLIQQVEEINESYNLSLKYTIYFNLFHFISGSKIMIYYKMEQSKGHIFSLKFLNPFKKNIIYLTKNTTIFPRFSLPKINSTGVVNKVVIFGSRYNDWKFLDLENFKSRLFSCFNIIKEMYSDMELIYIPHPLELGTEFDEINKLFNKRLRKVVSEVSSEYYLYNNRDTLITFSVGSTSSQSAFNMGIPSKVFYKCLDINNDIIKAFDQLFVDFPESFFIKNINNDFEFSTESFFKSNSNNFEEFSISDLKELIIT